MKCRFVCNGKDMRNWIRNADRKTSPDFFNKRETVDRMTDLVQISPSPVVGSGFMILISQESYTRPTLPLWTKFNIMD